MALPSQLQTTATRETFAGVTYQIEGELVPVLHVGLSQMPIYFEHHILLWKEPNVQIGIKPLKGAFKRMLSGMPIFMTETQGTGHIGFSRDGAGHIVAMPLYPGQVLDVREHQFLAATGNLAYNFAFVKGAANILFSGTGLFVDTFHCAPGDTAGGGMLFLHGHGNVFEVVLQPGEMIDVEPGGWLYKDQTVQMQTMYQGLKTGFFASAGQLVWNRFTGPGRVGIQSMYMPPVGTDGNQSGSTGAPGVGGVAKAIGDLLGN